MTLLYERIMRWLRCTFTGHLWRDTDVYHIEYGGGGYAVVEYYVVSCARCGKRQDEKRLRVRGDKGDHG